MFKRSRALIMSSLKTDVGLSIFPPVFFGYRSESTDGFEWRSYVTERRHAFV